ncbi:MAG: aminomethyl-transferring glycine dehydrogenase subunit GcvPB [Myxococcota bacterium]|nr:aminomethyl-transferring glycine dehydrogenase subunit GcvPB [Myxococcota bacterium]MDW8363951.1 aminomethyl-transferring glycine dehydrogenase subunit GcvPB [Myxococcales bacterium]
MSRSDEAATDLAYDEPLIFELGAPGRSGASLPALDVPEVDPVAALGEAARRQSPALPETSEPEVVRHYVRLSGQNLAIDRAMVPLGSCTMKYNPKVNEWAARLPGFARLHPLAPERMVQGALELMWRLERALAEICGLDAVCLSPAAGAQGELTGLMMIRAYHRSQGRDPRKVLVPDTAHGTNPASCTLNGLQAVPIATGERGILTRAQVASHLERGDVAAVMITNPNTAGLFESELPAVAHVAHEHGALVYGDGANLNAILGRVRPGDLGVDVMQFNLHKTFTTPHGGGGPGAGPVAFRSALAPFAPVPRVERRPDGSFALVESAPRSVGRVRAFHGNFGMMVRAYAYIREMGAEGLRQVSGLAVLNANYLRAVLGERWHVPFEERCMHEVVLSDRPVRDGGVSTLDVAKRLIDHGFHPPTIYFPLVVKGAMLVEPTETETRRTLDAFCDAMERIAREAAEAPERVRTAPHRTRLRRLDEARAARQPVLRWTPPAPEPAQPG